MNVDYLLGLVGGVCIGLASVIALAATGKIPGISGVFGRLFLPETDDRVWRVIFLLALIAGAGAAFVFSGYAAEFEAGGRGLAHFAVAGLLVGLGTRIGGGCTSGHGVCGVGQGQKDSIAATMTFVAVGMVTVLIMNQFLSR
jgi:uncharacterized membrane protein YedE/YeeE